MMPDGGWESELPVRKGAVPPPWARRRRLGSVRGFETGPNPMVRDANTQLVSPTFYTGCEHWVMHAALPS